MAEYASNGVALDWDDAPEPDFQYHRVYRSTDPDFVPGPDNLVHETVSSNWSDPTADPWDQHYKVTTLDHAGNESEAGSPGSVSSVSGGGLPTRSRLVGAIPNPFNPQTIIRFELPSAEKVHLRIFDLSGRRVSELIDGVSKNAGWHETSWDGRDQRGKDLPSGVYLYRVESEGRTQTKKMTLLK